MSRLHPDTLAVIRECRPDLDDIPDDGLSRLTVAAVVSLRLCLRDLGQTARQHIYCRGGHIRSRTGVASASGAAFR